MTTLTMLLDYASKLLALLVMLLAVLFVAWQIAEGVVKLTETGRLFLHFVRNERAFMRWLNEVEEERGK